MTERISKRELLRAHEALCDDFERLKEQLIAITDAFDPDQYSRYLKSLRHLREYDL